MNLLIVEDNLDIAANLGDYLEARGHTVDFAAEGVGGLALALAQDYDAIILDVRLPRLDGLALCRQLRTAGRRRVPVLMLTARDTLDDKLLGFEAGADDYLVKPFALQEVVARLKALARRGRDEEDVLQLADLRLDLGTLTVTRAGQVIRLNPLALKLLTLLLRAAPNVVTRRELEQALWHDDPPDSDALRSHLYALRQAIDKPFAQPLLHTVHGIGYRLSEQRSDVPS